MKDIELLERFVHGEILPGQEIKVLEQKRLVTGAYCRADGIIHRLTTEGMRLYESKSHGPLFEEI